ncbi:MAG: hypothetical protein ABR600_00700, partial [Actinomycetota bacterium]
MNRRTSLLATLILLLATVPMWTGRATARVVDPGTAATEIGLPAKVVDFTPNSINMRTYATTDYEFQDDPKIGIRQGTTDWRVVMGTGNAAELWLTATPSGRLLDLGGRYVNYSDDQGRTWKSVQNQDTQVNAEGCVLMAPNGDVLGVTWDPYSGDRLFTFKYSAAEAKWYYAYNPIHTPFWDRPGLHIVPGPFTTPLGTVPYISFIDGLPHDPWYYSTDGLNYINVSSQSTDTGQTTPVSQWLDAKADPSNDYTQANIDGLFPAFTPLGNGKAISDGTFFSPTDLKWHDFSLPDGTTQPGRIQV